MYLDVGVLVGKILNKIERKENYGDDELYFYCDNGEIYKMYHDQNCCESVDIDDICGELDDLVGSPILMEKKLQMKVKQSGELIHGHFISLLRIKDM